MFCLGRSGPGIPTEDLAFYWGHDPLFPEWRAKNEDRTPAARHQLQSGSMVAVVAHNGNPKPCGQGSCNGHDWPSNDWAPDMTLHNATWSHLGQYRGGYAIGFGGTAESYGTVPYWAELATVSRGLTIGMVVHPLPSGGTVDEAASPPKTLCLQRGVWSAVLDGANRVRWMVNTTAGTVTATGVTSLQPGPTASYVLKLCYNTSSGTATVFIDGNVDGVQIGRPGATIVTPHVVVLPDQVAESPAAQVTAIPVPGLVFGKGFRGGIEEIYLKNVSSENRLAYLFADDNRVAGTFLVDLTREAGRAYFASAINAVLDQAPFVAVQYDGFEKLQLISALDYKHSTATADSGLFRGPPTPDWYHYQGWPLRVGQGILSGVAAAAAGMARHSRLPPAVECSFQAPGFGAGRPDMAPYVDERIVRTGLPTGEAVGYVRLGLEWHPKLLYRTEQTGVVLNPYNTGIDDSRRPISLFEVDYWFGGLIAGGIAPQPEIRTSAVSQPSPAGEFDHRIGVWIRRYRRFGHATETGVQTLLYDSNCCHIQGDCEWVACNDAVASRLEGGTLSTPVTGVYWGAGIRTTAGTIPTEMLPENVTVLLFQSANGSDAVLEFGSVSRPIVQRKYAQQNTSIAYGNVVSSAPTSTSNQLLRLMPVSPTAGVVVLTGGWWKLRHEDVELSMVDESGQVKSRRMVFGHAQIGQRNLTINTSAAFKAELTFSFRKVTVTDSPTGLTVSTAALVSLGSSERAANPLHSYSKLARDTRPIPRHESSSIGIALSIAALPESHFAGTSPIIEPELLSVYPHDSECYTEGLVYDPTSGHFFQSAGQYQASRLSEVDPSSGGIVAQVDMDPSVFAEGVTIVGDVVYQLTYAMQTGYKYPRQNMTAHRESFQFTTDSGQGWGLTSNGTHLIGSDGTATLYIWDSQTLELVRKVSDSLSLLTNRGIQTHLTMHAAGSYDALKLALTIRLPSEP